MTGLATPFARIVLAFLLFPFTSAHAADDPRAALPVEARPCAVCHGNNGVSSQPGIPNLAGQRADYLAKQLRAMRASAQARLNRGIGEPLPLDSVHPGGRLDYRKTRDMDRQVLGLDNKSVTAIAGFFAALPRPCSPAAARAEPPKIVERCGVCHGRDGRDRPCSVPGRTASPLPSRPDPAPARRHPRRGVHRRRKRALERGHGPPGGADRRDGDRGAGRLVRRPAMRRGKITSFTAGRRPWPWPRRRAGGRRRRCRGSAPISVRPCRREARSGAGPASAPGPRRWFPERPRRCR